MIIELNPLDTLFFRDGKPFTMGEETWADGIFPPPPSVIYGALRTAWFAENGGIEKANTEQDPTNNLKINGIYYKYGDKICLPLPLDYVKEKDSEDSEVFVLNPFENPAGSLSNCPTKLLLKSHDNKELENLANGLIQYDKFIKYLTGELESFFADDISEDIFAEPKIGIGRDNCTRTSDESKLYRVGMRRIKNLSFIVDFDFLTLPGSGLMRLGGEGKAVSYQTINVFLEKPKLQSAKFKLYFSTPVFFQNGWLPGWLMENPETKKISGIYEGLELELLAAIIGKPIFIGGFDMKNKTPKPMRKVVPAGSVYYFELKNGDLNKVVDLFHAKSISEFGTKKEGFGVSFVGVFK